MPKIYQPFAGVAPSRSDNAYIYALVPAVGNALAAITSVSELLIVDRQDLSANQSIFFEGAPDGTNCLVRGDNEGQTLLCSGTDGTVATFDVRSQKRVAHFKIDRAVFALACRGSNVLVGTEHKNQQATVSIWDTRQNKLVWQNAENHDEITTVAFHPSRDNVVLTGGDDGLVSLFDATIAEEEDSLLQVVNHGPIHKAGFLGGDRIYALSSDQNFAVHPVSSPGDDRDPEPALMGDVRPLIPCQYVIDVIKSGEEFVLAAGTNIDASRLDLVRLDSATDLETKPQLNLNHKLTIEPAHGEEVIRSIYIDDETQTIYTAGEDGYIRASVVAGQSDSAVPKTPKTLKHKKVSDGRYKPY